MDFSKLYINGEWIDSSSGELIDVENPSDRSIIARVPRGNEEDVNRAVKSARDAFETWSRTKVETRIELMEKFVLELEKRIDPMSEIVMKELGAPRTFAKKTHIENYIENARDFIQVAKKYKFEEEFEGYTVRKEAVGVVASITPWNYPFGQITKKIFPAILAGNTVVLKPSQNTPLVAYYLTEAIDSAGLPRGVFNLVTGKGGEVGNVLAKHEDVDLISFTGSTTGGIEVGRLGLLDVKKLALELGGKSAAILLDSGDLETAFNVIGGTVFKNTGQTCSALSRLIAPRSRKNEVEEYFVSRLREMTFGPANEDLDLGPLASLKQWEKVIGYLDIAQSEGAKVLWGERPTDNSKGYFINPFIFTDVDNSMRIAQEEIFGPVLVIIYYDDLEEAIEIANSNKYGLSGAVFGEENLARKVARRLKTGMVIINDVKRTQAAPFGGYKQSGIGREGGIFGFEEFLEIKAIFE